MEPQTTVTMAPPLQQPSVSLESWGSRTNVLWFIIILLTLLLLLSVLGTHFYISFYYLIVHILHFFFRILVLLLQWFGFATGSLLNATADVTSKVAKTGVDVVDGAAHSVGNLLLAVSNHNPHDENAVLNSLKWHPMSIHDPTVMDGALKQQQHSESTVVPGSWWPNDTSSSIQQPRGTNLANGGSGKYCLVGEYLGRRGCVAMNNSDVCISGMIYPSKEACMKP
jgi:hypothetical protein